MTIFYDNNIIRNFVAKTCYLLDRCEFDAFLGLCSTELQYSIKVFSPEIRRDMVWLQHNLEGLKVLFEELPEHLQRTGVLLRHISYPVIEMEGGNINSITGFSLFHTDIDGNSKVLGVGHYHDQISEQGNTLYLTEREVRLDTRDLGIGLHVPI